MTIISQEGDEPSAPFSSSLSPMELDLSKIKFFSYQSLCGAAPQMTLAKTNNLLQAHKSRALASSPYSWVLQNKANFGGNLDPHSCYSE
jgi:hypothetical protein